jgi:hypothetical protein
MLNRRSGELYRSDSDVHTTLIWEIYPFLGCWTCTLPNVLHYGLDNPLLLCTSLSKFTSDPPKMSNELSGNLNV